MAKKAQAAKRDPVVQAERKVRIEDLRARLASLELLVEPAPRDAHLLARALLDDVPPFLAAMNATEDERTKAAVADARKALEPGEALSLEAVLALRGVVANVARLVDARDLKGLPAVRYALRRFSGIELVSLGALVLIVCGVLAMGVGAARDNRLKEFNAWFSKGSQRLNAQDYQGAVENFRTAIDLMPNDEKTAGAWNDYGWALFQLERYEEAIAAFQKALLLKPVFPLARNNLEAAHRKVDLKKSAAEKKP